MSLSLHAGPAAKTNRVPTDFAKQENPDQEKGATILREFRNLGIAGDYYLEFQLRVLPRRGEETVFVGQLWGSRNVLGTISRVVLADGHGGQRQLLIQNGPEPMAWAWQTGQTVMPVSSVEHLFEPLLPETELTLFDLQMPYLFWDDFVFEGVSKIMGRAAHTFLLRPPLDAVPAYASVQAVRVQLDTQFHALVQSTLYNDAVQAAKTLTVRDLKKVDDQWMVKAIDLRNELTRDKTRFQVTRAAVNLDLSPRLFDPGTLGETIARPTNLISLGP
ncbi:MAG: outer membrane lipoprotein-sorting protein [Cephaloticoccus sp.]|nr:outer membrane lipoprotein-sorting protein [Cephaloticoccus sp.]MCF7760401.1 outer membrane lipoprotein-sorting protein [Cephaloticoccus sp.]